MLFPEVFYYIETPIIKNPCHKKMNREYAKQTMDKIIFLPSNSLSMYFVPPVPRGLNRYVPVL